VTTFKPDTYLICPEWSSIADENECNIKEFSGNMTDKKYKQMFVEAGIEIKAKVDDITQVSIKLPKEPIEGRAYWCSDGLNAYHVKFVKRKVQESKISTKNLFDPTVKEDDETEEAPDGLIRI